MTLASLAGAADYARSRGGIATTLYVISNDEADIYRLAVRDATLSCRTTTGAFESVELVEGHGNVGFGAGHNLALERTTSDYHLVLNPDVLLDPSSLLRSVRFLEANPDAVMCAPQAYDSRGDYACLAKREPSLLVLILRGLTVHASSGPLGRRVGRYVYADRLPAQDPVPIIHASGCYMFCRTRDVQRIGGFDARYFLYFEDYDLSRRMACLGRIYELPDVTIRHMGGYTAQQGWLRILRFVRSASVFFRTYGWRLI